MRLSVIIPVFNVESYLRNCLESLLRQSFVDWEAVCVDDGSTDHSAEILKDFAAKDNRFKITTQPNGGLSSARNTGIYAAQGDYIMFLDSDDWLEPNALKTVSENLNGEDMLCFSGRRFFEETKSFNPADVLQNVSYESGMDYYNRNALLPRDFAFVCAVLRVYKRPFLLANNLHFKEGVYHEDNLFTPLACYYARNVKVINDCIYNYRVRSNSITTTNTIKRKHDMLGIANDLAAFFVSKSDFDKSVVYRAITHHYQVAFLETNKSEKRELQHLCDWRLYRIVSRTKLRHRLNYLRNTLGLV